jgi:hypothetical protein
MKTPKDPPTVDPDAIELAPGEWIATRRSLPSADFILVLHAPTRVVLLADPVAADVGLDEIADRIAAVVDEPVLAMVKRKPAPATSLRVDDGALAAAIGERLERTVPITVGPVPETERLVEGLAKVFDAPTEETNLLRFRQGRVDDQTLTTFFAAANRLYVRGPWELAHDSHVLGLEGEAFGWAKGACVCLIGDVGDHPGVLVFRALDEYLRFIEDAEKARLVDEAPLADAPVFSINFDAKREVPRERVKRAKAVGLRPADPQGFPWVQRFAPRNVPIDVDADDYAFAAALLDGLAALLEAHPDLFERNGLESPLAAEGAVDVEGQRRTLQLTAPHADMPWPWGDSAIEYYRWWEADEVRDEFLRATADAARTPADEAALANAVAQLFRCKIEHQNVEPLDFAHDDVEHFLLEYFPDSEVTEEAELPRVPDHIIQFVRWLAATDRIDAALADTLCEDADRLRDDFVSRAQNPAFFGPEKRLVVEMHAAGVDTNDEEAMARFVEDYTMKMSETADLAADGDRAVSEKKWTWTAGEPAPDPKGPCPCGSGKRYKKCCRPR